MEKTFQSDFALFLRKKAKLLIYQFFIEPKGKHPKEADHYKEVFLIKITYEIGDKPLMLEDKKY